MGPSTDSISNQPKKSRLLSGYVNKSFGTQIYIRSFDANLYIHMETWLTFNQITNV